MTQIDYPTTGPDTHDVSSFPHRVLRDDDTISMPGIIQSVEGDFYGIADHSEPLDNEQTSLVEVVNPGLAEGQDVRWSRGLITLRPGCRDIVLRTLALDTGSSLRIVRENVQRATVTVVNPPAPVGDGVAVIWVGKTQGEAKAGVGFPLVSGASFSEPYSGELWATSTVQGSLVCLSESIYSEGSQ